MYQVFVLYLHKFFFELGAVQARRVVIILFAVSLTVGALCFAVDVLSAAAFIMVFVTSMAVSVVCTFIASVAIFEALKALKQIKVVRDSGCC